MRDYCTLTRQQGELQCICDEKGKLYALDTPKGIFEMDPGHHNMDQLCMGIEALLANAKGSIVRTSVSILEQMQRYLPAGSSISDGNKVPAVIYPIFQGKLLCEFYNVTLHLDTDSVATPYPLYPEKREPNPRLSKRNAGIGYCIVDARTGLFLETNTLFQESVALDPAVLMRSRCEELGMKDLLLLATLNADRKCFFQAQFRANDNKHWFISESIIIDDRECIRIWSPKNVAFPESHLAGSELAKTYCSHWENKPARVLICDDNELLVDTCCSIMDWADIEYAVASNGKEALHHLESAEYHCVFLDLNMPKLNGFDTARLIRQSKRDYRSIPIIAMTATPLTDADLARQLKHFDAILQKPFDIEDVKTSVDQARRNLEMKQQIQRSHQAGQALAQADVTLLHQDYEPTPFMVQFSTRTEILEDLRKHILSTLESNLAFLEKLDARSHRDQLKALVQRSQSMAVSIGAWKLATHAGMIHEKLSHPPSDRNQTQDKEILMQCLEEALCFYNTVDWTVFIGSAHPVTATQACH